MTVKKEGKTLLLGFAKSNRAIAALMDFLGDSYEVFDEKQEKISTITLQKLRATHWEQVVLSPGFPRFSSIVQDLLHRGVAILNELDIAEKFLEAEVKIGITASVGKSTIAFFMHQLLEANKKRSFLGGNYGVPLSEYVLDVLQGRRTRVDYLILELSSYQLESTRIALDYSLIANMFPNHIDRYDSLEDYYGAKLLIQKLTRKKVFCLSPGGDLSAHLNMGGAVSLEFFEEKLLIQEMQKLETPQLLGRHNRLNLAFVLAVLKKIAFRNVDFEQLGSIKALRHRMEMFHSSEGVLCVNDSKATSMVGVKSAVSSIRERFPEKELYLLLGGLDKGHDWAQLKALQKDNKLKFCAFGESASEIVKVLTFIENSFSTLKEALKKVSSDISKQDILLLSPGGASHDEFKSFEDRGDFFMKQLGHLP